jgi:hypothetical protein
MERRITVLAVCIPWSEKAISSPVDWVIETEKTNAKDPTRRKVNGRSNTLKYIRGGIRAPSSAHSVTVNNTRTAPGIGGRIIASKSKPIDRYITSMGWCRQLLILAQVSISRIYFL